MRYILITSLALTAADPSAQQLDMAAIQKWGAARIAHYEVTAVYRGTATPLAKDSPHGVGDVTDSMTASFDWDLRTNALVGHATLKNGATKLGKLWAGPANECNPPTVSSTFEFFTAASATTTQGGLNVTGQRGYPDARVPGEYPQLCALKASKASQVELTVLLPVVSPVMALMPNGANPNLKAAADGKSFTLKNKEWAFTYVATIVK